MGFIQVLFVIFIKYKATLPDGFSIQEPNSPFKVFVHLEILFGRKVLFFIFMKYKAYYDATLVRLNPSIY